MYFARVIPLLASASFRRCAVVCTAVKCVYIALHMFDGFEALKTLTNGVMVTCSTWQSRGKTKGCEFESWE